MRLQYKHCQAFLSALLRPFGDGSEAYSPSFLLFLSHAVSWLPFLHIHEPLYVCHHLSRIVALRSLDVTLSDDPENPKTKLLSCSLSLTLQLLQHLRTLYKLTQTKLHSFLPHKVSDDEKHELLTTAPIEAHFNPDLSLQQLLDESDLDFNVDNLLQKKKTRKTTAKNAPKKKKSKKRKARKYDSESDSENYSNERT